MQRIVVASGAAAIVLLLAAWVMSTRPFTAPDEPSHYLRAVNLAEGHLLGPRGIYPQPLSPLAADFVAHSSRVAEVPDDLALATVRCVPAPPPSHTCFAVTPTGAYPPPAYVLPAAVLRVAGDPTTALWLSRLASAALCAALLVTAGALLWGLGSWAIVGLGLALTPMVLFVCSILNSSALELAAAVCFIAAVLRLSRAHTPVTRGAWAAFAASGALTIATFQAGAVFGVVPLLVGAVLAGRSRLREIAGRPAFVAATVLVLALVFWYAWGQWSGIGYETVRLEGVRSTLSDGAPQLAYALRDAVGTFGSLSVHLPTAVVWLWWGLVALPLLGAAVAGTARDRIALGLAALIASLGPIVLYAWIYQYSGFGLQGRQVLPLFMVVPLLAGEILARRLPRHRLVWVAAGALGFTAAVLQGYAWWFNARANAGTPAQPHALGGGAPFVPPLGWTVWEVAMVLGLLLALSTPLLASRTSPALR